MFYKFIDIMSSKLEIFKFKDYAFFITCHYVKTAKMEKNGKTFENCLGPSKTSMLALCFILE